MSKHKQRPILELLPYDHCVYCLQLFRVSSKKHVPHHSIDSKIGNTSVLMGSRKLKGGPHTQASQLDPSLRYSFLEYGTQNATQASGFPEFTQVSWPYRGLFQCLAGLLIVSHNNTTHRSQTKASFAGLEPRSMGRRWAGSPNGGVSHPFYISVYM